MGFSLLLLNEEQEFEGHKRDFGSLGNHQKFDIELVIPGAKDSDIYEQDNSTVILTQYASFFFFYMYSAMSWTLSRW